MQIVVNSKMVTEQSFISVSSHEEILQPQLDIRVARGRA